MAHRAEGCAAKPASLLASLIRFSAPSPLPVESHHHVDGGVHIGYEYAIGVFRRIEQLILLVLRWRLGLLQVTQRHEPVGSPATFRLVVKLALAVGVGARRPRPLRGFPFLHQARSLLRRYQRKDANVPQSAQRGLGRGGLKKRPSAAPGGLQSSTGCRIWLPPGPSTASKRLWDNRVVMMFSQNFLGKLAKQIGGISLSLFSGIIGGAICGAAILFFGAFIGRSGTTGEDHFGVWDPTIIPLGLLYGGFSGPLRDCLLTLFWCERLVFPGPSCLRFSELSLVDSSERLRDLLLRSSRDFRVFWLRFSGRESEWLKAASMQTNNYLIHSCRYSRARCPG